MGVRDGIAIAYTQALAAFRDEAQGYLQQIAQGKVIQEPWALGVFFRYYILRVSLVEQQLPGLIVLPWVPPDSSAALRSKDLLALQQDIDHVRVAVGFLLAN